MQDHYKSLSPSNKKFNYHQAKNSGAFNPIEKSNNYEGTAILSYNNSDSHTPVMKSKNNLAF